MELNDIIKRHNVDDIEKGLVFNYLKNNNIALDEHPFIKAYLQGFVPTNDLFHDVVSMKHTSLHELAVDMELLIPDEDRQTNGAFFTPKHIVDFIIETINPKKEASLIDISCGCGAFILGVIRYYISKYNKPIKQILKDNVYGVDLLDYNVRRCKLLIMLYGLSMGEVIDDREIQIITANSLTHNWNRKYDAVIGNPPYVKFQDMKDETRDLLEAHFTTTSFGTYNLYFAFFEIGLNLLNDRGKLGYITPNNYFTSLSGESLRAYFQAMQSVYKIVDFNSTKVFDVQTYTAITFLSKQKNKVIEYARISDNQGVQDFLVSALFTPNNYADLDTKKWRLLCENERDTINKIEAAGKPIGKLLNIAVGIATLKDEVYFINPYQEDELYYYCDNKYKSQFKIEKEVTRPLVKISKIKKQSDIDENKRRIIFPYYTNNGSASIIEEDVFKVKYPDCYAYLLSMKDKLAERGKGKHPYSPFYAYGRTQGLNKYGAKIYTPTFSQYPRFTLDTDPISLFTNGYGLFYRENNGKQDVLNLFSCLEDNDITSFENVDVLLKILNSGLMNYYVSKTSVSIDGGYPCYQKNFIERFSIPNLTPKDIEAIRKLDDVNDIDNYLLKLYQIKRPSPNLWE